MVFPSNGSLLIEAHLLPSLEYFCALLDVSEIIVEKHEHFSKQTYRNRFHVLTSHGLERLTIPLKEKHGKVMITDVRIDYSTRWNIKCWRTLESAYAKAPYYEHYADALRIELFAGPPYLYELNLRLLSLCLKWLKWEIRISESTNYEKSPLAPVIDARGVISAKKDFHERGYYFPQLYQQVFGSNFVPNLSLLDLIFCEGPGAAGQIRASRKKN